MKNHIFTLMLFSTILSCNKIGEDDPKISFRSRDKRLIGKWEMKNTFYYNDTPRSINFGYPNKYIIDIKPDGTYFFLDSQQKNSKLLGNWWWAAADQDFEKRERIVFNFRNGPWIEVQILEELRFKEIRTREYFDLSNFKRYYIRNWKRIKD